MVIISSVDQGQAMRNMCECVSVIYKSLKAPRVVYKVLPSPLPPSCTHTPEKNFSPAELVDVFL